MDLPSPDATLALVGLYGRLRARLRSELGQPKLVLPTSQYFPDRYDGSQAAAQRLVHRMQVHANIDDIPVEVQVEETGGGPLGSCSTGGCGDATASAPPRLELRSSGWALHLTSAELGHPVALTSTVARALGAIFLEETRPSGALLPQPAEINTELCATLLGFGVLTLEASYLYSKSCGGPRVTQLTALSAPELAIAVALFAADNQLPLRPALREVSTTQRALLTAAEALLRGNPRLIHWAQHALPDDPTPTLALHDSKPSLLGSWIARFSLPRRARVDDEMEALLEGDLSSAALARIAPPAKTSLRPKVKVDDELKALVAEALPLKSQ